MQRIAFVEFDLCQHVVGIDIGQAEAGPRLALGFDAATHHRRRIGLRLLVGITRPRQQQAGLVALGRVIEPHAVEARFVEGQRRKGGRDLVADHQPVGRAAALVRGDDQPVEKIAIGRPLIGPQVHRRQAAAALGDKTAARAGLRLAPVVDQPAATQRAAKGVEGLIALEDQADIAAIGIAREVAALCIPGQHVGLGQIARSVPLVHSRSHIGHRKGLAVAVDPRTAPAQGIGLGDRRPQCEYDRRPPHQ